MWSSSWRTLGACVWSLLGSTCLPADTRPLPAAATIFVHNDDGGAGNRTWLTEDGWTVTYDRLLISLRSAAFGGTDCKPYAGGGYGRIFDLQAESAAPQKLTVLFALGRCELRFSLRSPAADALLTLGVDEADRRLFRTSTAVAFVRGRGVKGGVAVNFRWTFGDTWQNSCVLHRSELASSESRSIVLAAQGDVFFRESPEDPSSPLRFDPFAAADVAHDANDDVTVSELDSLALEGRFRTLGERVRAGALPRLVRPIESGELATCMPSRDEED